VVALETLRRERRAEILKLAEQRGARTSACTAQWRAERPRTQATWICRWDLEDLLGVSVDIGSERGLHWFVRDDAPQEAVPL
jgi:hypothetical protein